MCFLKGVDRSVLVTSVLWPLWVFFLSQLFLVLVSFSFFVLSCPCFFFFFGIFLVLLFFLFYSSFSFLVIFLYISFYFYFACLGTRSEKHGPPKTPTSFMALCGFSIFIPAFGNRGNELIKTLESSLAILVPQYHRATYTSLEYYLKME